MLELSTFETVLAKINTLPWNYALYLPRNCEWDLQSPCIVLDPNDCEEDEEEPVLARKHNFRYALMVQDVQSIVRNAREQNPQIDASGLLKAFKYYFDHDAYIEF